MRHSPSNRKALLLGLVLLVAGYWAAAQGQLGARSSLAPNRQEPPSEFLVVRIYYEAIEDLAGLQSIDVWEYNNLQERYVLAALDLARYEALIRQGWKVEVDANQQLQLALGSSEWVDDYDRYLTVAELYDELDRINSAAPDLTEIVAYGESHCRAVGGCRTPGGDSLPGYPLLALRITNENVPGSSQVNGDEITRGTKPVFFLMANIHAREITTPEIALRMINYLIDGYGSDADATWIVDHREVWIVPTVNPDGHRLVELGLKDKYGGSPFYQRKNANNDGDRDNVSDCPVWPPSSYEQYGIDLNRNHSFGWGPPGSSEMPCDMTYRGLSEASEVEVRALERLVRTLIPDQRAAELSAPAPRDTTGLLITLHSFSNLVLWPWGNSELAAPNKADLKAIGDKLASYNDYLSCQPTYCLYATNGSTDDWAYGELGIPAFTFEIGDQFMPPYTEIDAIQWPDNRPALIYAAKIAHQPYMTANGPDTLALTAESSSQVTLRATIDDRTTGGDAIVAAMYSIDYPPEHPLAEAIPLAAADGEFDSVTEVVSGTLDLSGLEPGRHTLFVHGQDSEGYWGATSAEFFDVGTTWAFEKESLTGYASPGKVINYRITLELDHGGSDVPYDLAIEDVLPPTLTLLAETLSVNGTLRPELYDEDTRTLRYADGGSFDDQLTVTIAFEARVSQSAPLGSLIINTATAGATINGNPVPVLPASLTLPVLNIEDTSWIPVVVGP